MTRYLVVLVALAIVSVPAIVWAPDAIDAFRSACRSSPETPMSAIAIGDTLEAVEMIGPDERVVLVPTAVPGKATVFWFWSTLCPCVGDCETRILALLARYPDTMRFVAVDPHPQDTREQIEHLRKELGSPYGVYRDPDGSSVVLMGARSSASVAVFDETGTLRFRGAIDDALEDPTVSYINAAIDSILAGRPVDPTEPEVYGCEYPAR